MTYNNEEEMKQELDRIYAKIGESFYKETNQIIEVDNRYQSLFAEANNILFEIESNRAKQEGKKVCRKCSSIVSTESKYCNMCGAEIEDNNEIYGNDGVCIFCGTYSEEDEPFCVNCGADLQRKIVRTPKKESSRGDEKDINSNRESDFSKYVPWLTLASGVILVIMLIANSHECDRCHETFIGDSYYATFGTYDSMCEDCAKEYYRGINYKNYKN